MTATPARIGFILEPFRRAVAETPSAKSRYGSRARQTDDPVETFFDEVEDAQVMAEARQALLSPERRRFKVTAKDIDQTVPLLDAAEAVTARYVDPMRNADRLVLVSEITFDFAKQNAIFTVWG